MTELIIIAVYLSLLLGLGLFSSRLLKNTAADYMLASHSIGPFLLLMSIFGTTMTAFALVGSTGEAFKEGIGVYGMLASSSGIIHSLCFFLLGVKLWGLGKKYGYKTQIQFFRDRLGSDKIGLLLFPILVGLVVPYLLIGVMASGVVINSVTEGAFASTFAGSDYGVPKWLGSAVICGVVLIYVFFGGMRGTAWANTFQTIVFMILGVVTFFLISGRIGGIQAASEAVKEKHPSKLMRSVTEEEVAEYDKQFAAWSTLAHYNYAVKHKDLSLNEAQIQQAHSEFKPRMPGWQKRAEAVFAKKNDLFDLTKEERQKALILQDDRDPPADDAELFDAEGNPRPLSDFPRVWDDQWQAKAEKIFASKIGHPDELLDPDNSEEGNHWTRKKAWGIYKVSNWAPEEAKPLNKWKFFTYLLVPLSVGMFPHLFQHWLTAKSANSFKLPVVAHPIFIMIVWVPCVLVGVWATSATMPDSNLNVVPPHFPPNAVLSHMVKQLTGPLLGGLLTAGILAAIMSSLDSQFLCIGTMFTEDIAVHYSGKDRYTDRQHVLMARCFIIAIVIITYCLSLLEPRRVFTLGVWCFSGFSSLFPIVFAALYWRRLTKWGVYAGVLGAITSWIYLFWASNFAKNADYSVDFHIGGMNIETMPVVTMFFCSSVAMIIVSLVTSPPDEERLARFFPRK